MTLSLGFVTLAVVQGTSHKACGIEAFEMRNNHASWRRKNAYSAQKQALRKVVTVIRKCVVSWSLRGAIPFI
jgi:hypothetical protein